MCLIVLLIINDINIKSFKIDGYLCKVPSLPNTVNKNKINHRGYKCSDSHTSTQFRIPSFLRRYWNCFVARGFVNMSAIFSFVSQYFTFI